MQSSLYCSDLYIQFTFFLHFSCWNFFSRCQKPCHGPLHSPFSPLANGSFPPSLLFPLGVCLQHEFDRWFRQLQIHGDPSDAEAAFPLLPCQKKNDFFWMHFTSINLIVLPRNVPTIYAVRLSYVNIVVGVPVPPEQCTSRKFSCSNIYMNISLNKIGFFVMSEKQCRANFRKNRKRLKWTKPN